MKIILTVLACLCVALSSAVWGQDTTPPVITVPANITVPATSAAGAVVNFATPTATDNVGVTFFGRDSLGSFNNPSGVAVDGGGNVYVADTVNHTIRKITSAGVVSTFAGVAGAEGKSDGAGSAARFTFPCGVAVDGTGNVYVADTGNQTIRKITPKGVVSTLAGSAGEEGSEDGTGSAARFSGPWGVAVDKAGNVYVADQLNGAIRKITPAGVVSTYVSADVTAGADIQSPKGVAVDGSGNVYWTERGSYYGKGYAIKKITPEGNSSVFAGVEGGHGGSNDGSSGVQFGAARFSDPEGVAVDKSGNVYVSDAGAIRKITPSGVVSTLAGVAVGAVGSRDGIGSTARFNRPSGVAVDGSGNVYVADLLNHTIRKISPVGAVSTFAGSAGVAGIADGGSDGEASAASFLSPQGVAVDGSGNVYVADTRYHTVRKASPAGVVSTLAGNGGDPSLNIPIYTGPVAFGDSIGVEFVNPSGVAVDKSGNVYVADTGNNKIRKITPAGVVSILAGDGLRGSQDGTGSAASFTYPSGVAVDGVGNVYVADTYNNAIRKITPAGVVSTLVGYSQGLLRPSGVAVDGGGNVYVADTENHTICKITPEGVVSTLAGSTGEEGSADGTGSAARFKSPRGVAVDGSGNVYVADTENHTIRKITPEGVVSTFAGNAGTGSLIDGTGSAARFNSPSGVAVDGIGNVYVSDTGNQTIRKITPSGDVGTIAGVRGSSYHLTFDSPDDGYTLCSGCTFPGGVTSLRYKAQDAAGNTSFAVFTVTVEGAPVILRQPEAYDGETGTSPRLSVEATGGKLTLYQWRKNGVNIKGANSSTYDVANAVLADAGAYDCVVSNKFGSVTSSQVAVVLEVPPARFNNPSGVAVDKGGNVYVADTGNHTIRKITPAGVVSTFAGKAGVNGSNDGTGSAARFNSPGGVALDKSGNVYVADTGNHTIRKITPAGVVSTFAGSDGNAGFYDGITRASGLRGVIAAFTEPTGVAVDGSGNVYVADTGNNAIRKITPAGVVSTLAGRAGVYGSADSSSADGIGSEARFICPVGVAVDGIGNVYVADRERFYGDKSAIRLITPAGVVKTLITFDTLRQDVLSDNLKGTGLDYMPRSGIAVDERGTIYVSDDYYPGKVYEITPAGKISPDIRWSFRQPPSYRGYDRNDYVVFINGEFAFVPTYKPTGVAVDKNGDIYISDRYHSIRKLTPTLTTFAGDPFTPGSTDTISTSGNTGGTSSSQPVISKQPVATSALLGETVRLTVAATGALSYQWRKDGVVISGTAATGTAYSFTPSAVSDSGSYDCVVTNSGGSVTSASASVVVSLPPLPTIKVHPAGGTLSPNGSIKLSVTATSPVPLTYQWRKNETAIIGATSASYTVAASGSEPAGRYDCVVKNGGGEITTNTASVLLPQTITYAQPAPVTYGVGPIILGGSASSGSPLSYKVVSGSAIVSGSTLTITGAGSVVLKVSQTGDVTHAAAADVSKTLVVAKKTLTVSAGSKTRLVGAANPTFTLMYSGFVSGDTEAVLDKKPTATTTAKASSAEGSYPVTISGGSDNNYTLVYSTGATLLVTGFGGAYEALLLDSDHIPIGKLELTVPLNSLAYSGKLTLTTEAKPVTLVGVLQPNNEGTAAESTVVLTRKDLPTLTLNMSVEGDALTATLGRGGLSELTSGTTGSRLYTVPAKASAPWAGTYTMVFREPTSSDTHNRDYPHGANYASVIIAPTTGILTFTGKQADGTPISGGLKPDPKGRYRLLNYGARLNTYLGGQLSLLAHPDTARFPNSFYIPSSSEESFLVWANIGGAKDNSYRAGFGPLDYSVSLDPWHAPVTGSKTVSGHTLGQRLGLVSGSTDSATISVDYGPDSIDLGALGASLPREVSLAPGGAVSVIGAVNATKWIVSVTPATGVFTGSFSLVDALTGLAAKTTRNVTFSGILRQAPEGETAVGSGFFLLPALPSATTTEQPSLQIQLSVPAK